MARPDHEPGYVPNPDYSQEDWDDVCDDPELTEDELSRLRPAREVLPPALFPPLTKPRGRPKVASPKVPITIRLDRSVVEAFKATGTGWQTRINAVLRDAAAALPRERPDS